MIGFFDIFKIGIGPAASVDELRQAVTAGPNADTFTLIAAHIDHAAYDGWF